MDESAYRSGTCRGSSSSSALRRSGALALIALAWTLAFGASSAFAAKSAVNFFGAQGAGDGQLSQPRDVAVNESTGDVYVVEDSNHRISVFDSDGEFVDHIGESGTAEGQFDNPQGIAIDQDTGDIFVTDRDNRRVQRFDSDGDFKQTWGWGVDDGTAAAQVCTADCQAGLPGNGAGQLGSGSASLRLDVSKPDGTAGNVHVYVADPANRRIQEFMPDDAGFDGTPADAFGASGTGLGQFGSNQPLHVAVDADGIVYASDSNASNRVQRYDTSTDAFRPAIDVAGISGGTSTATTGLEVDADTDSLYVARNAANGIVELDLPADPDDPPTLAAGSPHALNAAAAPQGIGIDPGAATIYMSTTTGGHRVFIIRDAVAPEPAIAATTDVTATSATFHGSVDPNGGLTDYIFELSDDGGASWTPLGTAKSAGAGDDPVPVSRVRKGLKPGTDYLVRLVATASLDPSLSATSASDSFTTDPAPPRVSTMWANQLKPDAATLVGRVNPSSEPTTYWFEWGADQSYGNAVPAAMDGDAGSGAGNLVVSERITGLDPETTYHFRLVAENDSGRTAGADRSFETPATVCPNEEYRTGPSAYLADCRAYELVSNFDKGGARPWAVYSRDGLHVGMTTLTLFPALDEGGLGTQMMLAERSEQGWQPAMGGLPSVQESALVRGWSDDVGRRLVMTKAALADGDDPTAGPNGDGDYDGYLVDRDRSTTWLTEGYPGVPRPSGQGDYNFASAGGIAGAMGDLSSFAFASQVALTADAPPPPATKAYVRRGDHTHLIGRLPDGSLAANAAPAPCGGVTSLQECARAVPTLTPDGKTALYLAQTPTDGVRLFEVTGIGSGSEDVVEVSAPENGAPPADASYPINFQASSPDLSKVLFRTRAPLVTDDDDDRTGTEANNVGADLYLWDRDATPHLTRISASPLGRADVSGFVNVSTELDRVYFVAAGAITDEPGPTGAQPIEGRRNLYLWDEGQLRFVATLGTLNVDPLEIGATMAPFDNFISSATPDGSALLFSSGEQLLDDVPTAGTRQAYRYDRADHDLECVSCVPGVEPTGDVDVAPRTTFPGSRHLSDDGDVALFRSPDRLVPRDSDDTPDVYTWHDGEVQLISSGNSASGLARRGSQEATLSGDGRVVLFGTYDRLVEADRDGFYDIYAAVVDGGFPPPEPDPSDCEGAECQGPPTDPPADDSPGSSDWNGAGNEGQSACAGRIERRATRLDRQASKLERRADRLTRKAKRAKRSARRSNGAKAKRQARRAKRLRRRSNQVERRSKRVKRRVRAAQRRLQNCKRGARS